MKKIVSLLLVVMLLAGLSVSALAAEVADSKELVIPPEVLDEDTTTTFVSDTNAVKAAVEALTKVEAKDILDENNAVYGEVAKAMAEANEANGTAYQSLKFDKVFEIKADGEPAAKTIKTPDKFVGMFKLVNGKWEKVETEFDENGNIVFTPEKDVVYAIVVGDETAPATGESVPYALIVAAVVLAGSAVVFFRKSRKANA